MNIIRIQPISFLVIIFFSVISYADFEPVNFDQLPRHQTKSDISTARKTGIGISFGSGKTPSIGLSIKHWSSSHQAFQLHFGPRNVNHDLFAQTSYLFHLHQIAYSEAFEIFWFTGPGIFYGFDNQFDHHAAGVFADFGLNLHFLEIPIDISLEFAPTLQIASSTGLYLTANLASRYYF